MSLEPKHKNFKDEYKIKKLPGSYKKNLISGATWLLNDIAFKYFLAGDTVPLVPLLNHLIFHGAIL